MALPPELLLLIFSMLNDPLDLLHCSLVCRAWHAVCADDRLWFLYCTRLSIISDDDVDAQNNNPSGNTSYSGTEYRMVFRQW